MKTILIVEDNPSHARLACALLNHAGYATLTAETGEAALRLARESQPALVLMDISLPGMDGLEATRQLKLDPTTREIPVIALTAYLAEYSEAAALAAGCSRRIAKPYHYKELLAAIAETLGAPPAP